MPYLLSSSCRLLMFSSKQVYTHTLFFPLNFSSPDSTTWCLRSGQVKQWRKLIGFSTLLLSFSFLQSFLPLLDQSLPGGLIPPNSLFSAMSSLHMYIPWEAPPISEPFLVLQSIKMHLFSATVSFSFIDDESTIEFSVQPPYPRKMR